MQSESTGAAILRVAFLGRSRLTPDEESAREARELLAAGNRFRDLRWLRPLINLVVIDVRQNLLESASGIEACSNLAILDVRDNKFESADELCRALSRCVNLEQVDATRLD